MTTVSQFFLSGFTRRIYKTALCHLMKKIAKFGLLAIKNLPRTSSISSSNPKACYCGSRSAAIAARRPRLAIVQDRGRPLQSESRPLNLLQLGTSCSNDYHLLVVVAVAIVVVVVVVVVAGVAAATMLLLPPLPPRPPPPPPPLRLLLLLLQQCCCSSHC